MGDILSPSYDYEVMLCVRKGKVQISVLQIVYPEPAIIQEWHRDIFPLAKPDNKKSTNDIAQITVAGFKLFYIRRHDELSLVFIW